MIEALTGQPRLIVDARLSPIVGSTFQPTGFADLGAAPFRRPGDEGLSVLVESVQSMTNHLEAVGWDRAAQAPGGPVSSLPYVQVKSSDGDFLTSSRTEPHRLASAYVADAAVDGSKGEEWITERLALRPNRPLDYAQIYRSVLEMDPMCLLHGVFFSRKVWTGNPKVRRAISCVIEAHDAAPAASGGLKRDDVSFKSETGRAAEQGYGFVPFPRTEYTAREIILTAAIDLSQIRGYGLGERAAALLTLIALWELTSLLHAPLRLRTACDLEVESVTVRRPAEYELPDPSALADEMVSASLDFEHAGARHATWPASNGGASKPKSDSSDRP